MKKIMQLDWTTFNYKNYLQELQEFPSQTLDKALEVAKSQSKTADEFNQLKAEIEDRLGVPPWRPTVTHQPEIDSLRITLSYGLKTADKELFPGLVLQLDATNSIVGLTINGISNLVREAPLQTRLEAAERNQLRIVSSIHSLTDLIGNLTSRLKLIEEKLNEVQFISTSTTESNSANMNIITNGEPENQE